MSLSLWKAKTLMGKGASRGKRACLGRRGCRVIVVAAFSCGSSNLFTWCNPCLGRDGSIHPVPDWGNRPIPGHEVRSSWLLAPPAGCLFTDVNLPFRPKYKAQKKRSLRMTDMVQPANDTREGTSHEAVTLPTKEMRWADIAPPSGGESLLVRSRQRYNQRFAMPAGAGLQNWLDGTLKES
jgi:hypothetical protein